MSSSKAPAFIAAAPSFENLEDRLFLAGTAPVFATALADKYWLPDAGVRTIGIDGYDIDADALTITATSTNPLLDIYVPQFNRYARMYYVDSSGNPIGEIVVQLFDDRSPAATDRFVTLSTNAVAGDGTLDPFGTPFYTDVLVHRVIPDFMIQTGDAVNGTGTGGSPLGAFADSFDPDLVFAGAGALAMANSGPDTNDSQFFITDAPTRWLDGRHMIFGQIVSGWGVLDTIINLPRNSSDRPNNPPKLAHVEIFNSIDDATVSIKALAGFTGEANVTISLDDGNGNITTKVIKVRQSPELTNADRYDMLPGTTLTLPTSIANAAGLNLAWTITSGLTGGAATIDAAGTATITPPAGFVGLMPVTIRANDAAWSDSTPVTQTIFVSVAPQGAPTLLTRIGDGVEAMSTFVSGDYLYAAMGSAGLQIFDISERDNPVLVSSTGTLYYSARDVVVSGNTAYVLDLWGGIFSFDVTDPANPAFLDSVAMPNNSSMQPFAAISMELSGNTMWVANYDGGLSAFNVANPAAMTLLSNMRQPVAGVIFGEVGDLAIKGTYLYLTDASGFVAAIDITNPAAPGYLGKFNTAYSPWGIEIVGDRMYVVDQGLVAYNLTNPATPLFAGFLPLGGSPWQVAVKNNLAIVATASGYVFVDVTKPTKMVATFAYSAPNFDSGNMVLAGEPSFAGSAAMLPFGATGIAVVNTITVRNGSVKLVDENGVPYTFKITGGEARIYTTDVGGGQIQKIDIIDSNANTTVAITTPGGRYIVVQDVDVAGSLKSFTGKGVNLMGNFDVAGSLGALTVASIASGVIVVDGTHATTLATAATVFAFSGVISDVQIVSNLAIKSFKAAAWNQGPGTESLIAPSIGSLTVAGNFDADLQLDGTSGPVALGTVKIGSVNTQTWLIDGAVGAMTIGSATGLTMNAYANGITTMGNIAIGTASAVDITAVAGISGLKAAAWTGGSITAGAIKALTIAGNFDGNVILDGTGLFSGLTLGTAKISGALDNGIWGVLGNSGKITAGSVGAGWSAQATGAIAGITTGNFAGDLTAGSIKAMDVKGSMTNAHVHVENVPTADPKVLALGKLTVKGWVDGSEIHSDGRAGAITVGGMKNSAVEVGLVDPATETHLVDAPADFAAVDALAAGLASFTVKGILGEATTFRQSNVSAWSIGKVSLLDILTTGSEAFGIAANGLTSLATKIGGVKYSWTPTASAWPADNDAGDQFLIRRIV